MTIQPKRLAAASVLVVLFVSSLFCDDPSRFAEPNVYHVSPKGSNSNTGISAAVPLRSIAAALAKVQPGDTVLLHPGVYRESILNMPGGASPERRVRIAAYDPDDRPVIRPSEGASRVFSFASEASSYVELDGLVLDADEASFQALRIHWGTGTGGSHHIRVKNTTAKNSRFSGILADGSLFGVRHNEFLNVDVHHNGLDDHHHGIYIASPFNVIEDSTIHNNAGWGIHTWSGDPSDNTYRSNVVYNNAQRGRGAGISAYHGDRITIANNMSLGNKEGIDIRYRGSEATVERNISVGNGIGLRITADVQDTQLANNIVVQNRTNVTDKGVNTSTTSDTSNPAEIRHWDTGTRVSGTAGADELGSRTLTRVAFTNADLENAAFGSSSLYQATFIGANLQNADLSRTWLRGSQFDSAQLGGADFTGATLAGVGFENTTDFTEAQLKSTASYQNQNLRDTRWSGTDLSGWTFTGQDLTNATFTAADLRDADLSEAVLANVSFGSPTLGAAVLSGTNLTDAIVTSSNFDNTTANGLTASQFYSTKNYQIKNLDRVSLADNDLSGWDLNGQSIRQSGFQRTKLSGTDLSKVNASDSSFLRATLDGADLSESIFARVELAGTSLEGTILNDTVITRANLVGAKGFAADQLYSTANYKARELIGVRLDAHEMSGWVFANINLTATSLKDGKLGGADFEDATIGSVNFRNTTAGGFTREQLYSTASYQSQSLVGVNLSLNDLAGWNFSNQDLNFAAVSVATLLGTNFDEAIVTATNFDNTTASGFTAQQLYSTRSYQDRNLTRIRLTNNDLTGWDFSSQLISRGSFRSSNLTNASLANADLSEADLSGTTLAGTDLTDAVITRANLERTSPGGLTAAQFYSTANYQTRDLTNIRLGNNDLSNWDFSNQNLSGISVANADLSGASLANANLNGADLQDAQLAGTNFSGASIRGAELSRVALPDQDGFTEEQLRSTASYQRRDLRGVNISGNQMSGWDFSGQDLSRAFFFYDVDLSKASLASANLFGADLRGAELTDTDFTDADISFAVFEGRTGHGLTEAQIRTTQNFKLGNLRGVNLRGNDLSGWDFGGLSLEGASFKYATMEGATLTDATITDVDFANTSSRGFTDEMLYSTASYKTNRLMGVNLSQNDLAGWDLSHQVLHEASFIDTRLTNTNLSGADLRGAVGLIPGGDTRNMIWPNGEIRGLSLAATDRLVIRDSDRQVVVRDEFSVAGRLELVLSDDLWTSTITFDEIATPGTLSGDLVVSISSDNPNSLIGTTFDLFDWPTEWQPSFGSIDLPGDFEWDASRFLTTGEIILLDRVRQIVAGDFDGDSVLGIADIDLLSVEIAGMGQNKDFDLSGEGEVNGDDLSFFLGLANKLNGDADFDGEVQFSDFLILADNFGETDRVWSKGDFDADGEVQFPDFLILANNFGQSLLATRAVPEPSAGLPGLVWVLVLIAVRRLHSPRRCGLVS